MLHDTMKGRTNMKTNKWYISLQLNQDYKITVYDNGIVYGPNRGEKLFQLNEETMTKIRTIIEKVRPFLAKNKRCLKNREGKFIIRINNTSRRTSHYITNDVLKIISPDYDKLFFIIKNINNHSKSFIHNKTFVSEEIKVYDEFEEAFYRFLSNEEKSIINTLIKTYNTTLVLKALKVAVNDKLPSLLYIKDILNYWNKFNNSDIVPNLKLNKWEYFLKTVAN